MVRNLRAFFVVVIATKLSNIWEFHCQSDVQFQISNRTKYNDCVFGFVVGLNIFYFMMVQARQNVMMLIPPSSTCTHTVIHTRSHTAGNTVYVTLCVQILLSLSHNRLAIMR